MFKLTSHAQIEKAVEAFLAGEEVRMGLFSIWIAGSDSEVAPKGLTVGFIADGPEKPAANNGRHIIIGAPWMGVSKIRSAFGRTWQRCDF